MTKSQQHKESYLREVSSNTEYFRQVLTENIDGFSLDFIRQFADMIDWKRARWRLLSKYKYQKEFRKYGIWDEDEEYDFRKEYNKGLAKEYRI